MNKINVKLLKNMVKHGFGALITHSKITYVLIH